MEIDRSTVTLSHKSANSVDDPLERSRRASSVTPIAYFKVVNSKAHSGPEKYPIYYGKNVIGRGEDCDVQICEDALSRQHASLEVERDLHFLSDLGSHNGTYRNSRRMKTQRWYEIFHGTRVKFAHLEMIYSVEGASQNGHSMTNEEETQNPMGESEESQESHVSGTFLQGENVIDMATLDALADVETLKPDAPEPVETVSIPDTLVEQPEDTTQPAPLTSLVASSSRKSMRSYAALKKAASERKSSLKNGSSFGSVTSQQGQHVSFNIPDSEAVEIKSPVPLSRDSLELPGDMETEVAMELVEDSILADTQLPPPEVNGGPGRRSLMQSVAVVESSPVVEKRCSFVAATPDTSISSVPRGSVMNEAEALEARHSCAMVLETPCASSVGTAPSAPSTETSHLAGRRPKIAAIPEASPTAASSPPSGPHRGSGGGVAGRRLWRPSDSVFTLESSNMSLVTIQTKEPDTVAVVPDSILVEDVLPEEDLATQPMRCVGMARASLPASVEKGRARGRGGRRSTAGSSRLHHAPEEALADDAATQPMRNQKVTFSSPVTLANPGTEMSLVKQEKTTPQSSEKRGRGRGKSALSRGATVGGKAVKKEKTSLGSSSSDEKLLAPGVDMDDVGGEDPFPAPKEPVPKSTARGRRKAAPDVATDEPPEVEPTSKTTKASSSRARKSPKVISTTEPVPGGMNEGSNESLTTATGQGRRKGSSSMDSTTSGGESKKSRVGRTPSTVKKEPKVKGTLQDEVSSGNFKIMFTGIDEAQWRSTVLKLGGEVVQDFNVATHLVTEAVRRTVKLMGSLVRGLPVVSVKWLVTCQEMGHFVDTAGFELSDLQPAMSRVHSALQPLFHGWTIFVTSTVRPEAEQLREIVAACGGCVETDFNRLSAVVARDGGDKVALVATAEDLGNKRLSKAVKSALQDGPTKFGVPVKSPEFLLTTFMNCSLDVESHTLVPSSHSDTIQSTGSTGGKSKKRTQNVESNATSSSSTSKRTRTS